MKLKIENDSTSNLMDTHDLSNDVSSANGSAEVTEMLREGIKAAQEGNRAVARHLLMQATELEPKNENAWLWLASISEYPEELLIFLNNVLRINSKNERALEWEKSTKSLLSKTFVKRGIEASKESQSALAKQSFLQAIVHDDKNEMAWLWLASISDTVDEKKSHLQKVLRLNPSNETALSSLGALKQSMSQDMLRKAQAEAISGKSESALKMVETLLKEDPDLEDAWLLKCYLTDSFSQKMDYLQKVLEINSENKQASAGIAAMKSLVECVEPRPDSDIKIECEIEVPEIMFAGADEEMEAFEPPQEQVEETPEPVDTVIEYAAVDSDEIVAEFQIQDFKVQEVSMDKVELPDSTDHGAIPQSESSVELVDVQSDELFDTDNEESEMDFAFQESLETGNETASNAVEASDANMHTSEMPLYHDEVEAKADAEIAGFENGADVEMHHPADFSEDFPTTQSLPASEPIEMPEELLELNESVGEKLPTDMVNCPFCSAENEHLGFICHSCKSMMTMSDVDMMLSYTDGDLTLVQQKVDQLERDHSGNKLDAEGLKLLAIGLLNLSNLRRGYECLQEASQLDPNDVVLSSHINSLAIRLSEMDEQKTQHDSIPKNKTILVVDDSATVRKLVSGKLEKCGLEVICAVDGMDALEKINENIPDLILLDITMPRMDGYQVCKMIRGNEATKDVPVVMISGKDGFFDKVRGRMAGTTGYITKPFGPETLMKTVEAYI